MKQRAFRAAHVRGVAALLCLATACRSPVRVIPGDPPSFTGQVAGFQLNVASEGPGGLRLLRLQGDRSTSAGPSAGFARVDGGTKFVTTSGVSLDWSHVGLRDLVGARARVWFRGAPTSETPKEIWGDAQVVVIDETDSLPIMVARVFSRYAESMLSGDRAALVDAYSPAGVRVVSNGESVMLSPSDVAARYSAPRWSAPAAFAWKDLSWEPVGPDAYFAFGRYDVRARADAPVRTYSYSALLRRRDGKVGITIENVWTDSSSADR